MQGIMGGLSFVVIALAVLVFVLALKNILNIATEKNCPFCKKRVKKSALKCPYCQSELTVNS